VDYDSIIPQNQDRILFNEILVKFTYLVGMIADQNFYDICFRFFYPIASATAYGRRPKFFMNEHSATAEGENCGYGPTLLSTEAAHSRFKSRT
jgi:hypothetical protein